MINLLKYNKERMGEMKVVRRDFVKKL